MKTRLLSTRKDASAFYFHCINCGEEAVCHPHSAKGKFCSNVCSVEFKRKETNARVEAGLGTSYSLKRYLLDRDGALCTSCGITEWMGKPISLHLDHIDGNSDNNRLENGRILCPNCHSQTETFTGRNKKNTRRNRYLQNYKSEKRQTR